MARKFSIEFAGLTHDHSTFGANCEGGHEEDSCSVIATLKRHPMYDCLLLVKKFRTCLGHFALEFPIDKLLENEKLEIDETTNRENATKSRSKLPCNQQRLVSRFLDGDDPILQQAASLGLCCSTAAAATTSLAHSQSCANFVKTQSNQDDSTPQQVLYPFATQLDDKGDACELVHVPINGLLDRLENYTKEGVSVDSRVYAFAMGLKTAERLLTTQSMKELQETPI